MPEKGSSLLSHWPLVPMDYCVWGKTDLYDQPRDEQGEWDRDSYKNWMPLLVHMSDSGLVALHLWDRWLSKDAIDFLVQETGMEPERLRRLVAFFAATHDIGKADPRFVRIVPSLAALAEQFGLPDRAVEKHHHSIVGGRILKLWAMSRGASEQEAISWASIASLHHGRYSEDLDSERLGSAGKDPNWRAVQERYLDLFHEKYLYDIPFFRLSVSAQMIIVGIVVLADWTASNKKNFPLTEKKGSFGETMLVDLDERCDRALSGFGFLSRWEPALLGSPSPYATRFEIEPRPTQSLALRLALEMDEPGLMIVEAPMGEGKTEAALVAGEILAERFGKTGLIFGLPSRTATDRIWGRMQKRFSDPVWLIHGQQAMNSKYKRMNEIDHWLNSSKQDFLAPISAVTVDHILDTVQRHPHSAVHHLAMFGKVVVIDEVHSYDPWMNMFMDTLLKWLHHYHVPVILLSATLPPERRKELLDAYGGQPYPDELEGDDKYPLIVTAAGGTTRFAVPDSPSDRKEVTFAIEFSSEGEALRRIREVADAGGTVLVIRNLVNRAIDTYEDLARHFSGENVTVTHSKFTVKDRAENDEELEARHGKDGDHPAGHIVVATQVAEQSLDLDFDLLVTDIAPLDTILQRMGRAWRHDRPRPVPEAKCVILRAEAANHSPYLMWPVLRSISLLKERRTVTLPTDIAPLVRAAYEEPSAEELGTSAWAEWEEVERGQKSKAATWVIPGPRQARSLFDVFRDATRRPMVRDSDDSEECVLLILDGDEWVVPGWIAPNVRLNPNDRPTPDQLAVMHKCILRVRKQDHPEESTDRWLKEVPTWKKTSLAGTPLMLAEGPDLRFGKHTYTKERGFR